MPKESLGSTPNQVFVVNFIFANAFTSNSRIELHVYGINKGAPVRHNTNDSERKLPRIYLHRV